MRFNDDLLIRYLSLAPVPLALERVLESRIHREHEFIRPVLDIGCGEGLLAQVLFADNIDTGIDPNPRELARARQLGGYDELIECRGDAIPKPDGWYKTAFSNSVLEHIPDIEPVFREVHRVLAPEGRFYITVPSDQFDQYSIANQILTGVGFRSLAARYRRFFNSFWKHYHYYPLDTWRGLASRCGFEVIECYTFDPKSVCLINDFLAPLSILSYLNKQVTNRWILFPRLRRFCMSFISPIASWLVDGGEKAEHGGLVYMSLKKSSNG
jgi:SAM-dependent methyltransferase